MSCETMRHAKKTQPYETFGTNKLQNPIMSLTVVAKNLRLQNKNRMTNKNYKIANYTVTIELPKSPNDVFSHLINLKKWWPEDFEGEDIKLNCEFVFTT